jgi:hypothetical protein
MSRDLLQEMLDYKEIVELKARFGRTVDAKDWAGYTEVFSADAVFDFGDGNLLQGGPAFVAAVRDQLEGGISVHRAYMPEITFTGPDEAEGIWAVNDYLEWEADPVTGTRRGYQGFGREYETYRKIGGAWKIVHWRLRYDRMDPLLPQPLPDRVAGGPALLRDDAYIAAVVRPEWMR